MGEAQEVQLQIMGKVYIYIYIYAISKLMIHSIKRFVFILYF